MTCYYTEPSLSLHQQGCLSPHLDQSSLVDLCTEVRSLPFAGFLLPSDVLPYPQKWGLPASGPGHDDPDGGPRFARNTAKMGWMFRCYKAVAHLTLHLRHVLLVRQWLKN